MATKIKNKLKGTETRADIWDKIGGAGGGARRTSKKAKAKKDTSPVRDYEAERLYGDWFKKGGKHFDEATRKSMKKTMKHPDYGKKFIFSKERLKRMGLE